MGERIGLLRRNKPKSVSTAERRLRRYLDVDAARRAKEKLQLISSMKASKAARKQRVNDLKEATAKAAKAINGADDSAKKVVPEWRAEAQRRLAAAENTWPHKLGASLQRWGGKKPNGI